MQPDPNQTRREPLMYDAIDPISGKLIVVQVRHDRLLTAAKVSVGHVKEIAFTVPYVLLRPTVIFEGLKKDGLMY